MPEDDRAAGAGAERPDSDEALRPIEPDDLFRLRFATSADLSPDGESVVFALSRTDVEANTDHTDLVQVAVSSGGQRQLTSVDAVHAYPAFAPDGREIAFLSTRTGVPQIFALPLDGGEARQLTAFPDGVGGGPVFSPDGTRIAFTAVPPGTRRDPALPYRVDRAAWRADGVGVIEDALQDVYVVAAEGGEPVRLTEDRSLNTAPQWTPDGAALVFNASFDPESMGMLNRLRRVDLDGSVSDVASGGAIASHAVCPDGRIAYVLTNEDGRRAGSKADLWVYDPETGVHQRRTTGLVDDVGGRLVPDMPAFAFTMAGVLISADSRHAYLPAQRGGEVRVLRVGLSGAESHEPVAGGERGCAPVRLRGNRLLFAAFGIRDPGDLHVLDTATGTESRLTELNAELLARLEWPAVHHLEFTSTDGTAVEGWYLEPARAKRPLPTLLGIHGGPHAGWGHTFVFDFLMLAGAGYGVLFVNHRGSTGYGDDFGTAITSDWGNLDCADLMAGVDHAIAIGLADSDRLGVFGASAGGTLSGWLTTQTDRFRAACPEDPLFDFSSMYGTSDIGIWAGRSFMGGDPHERAELYRRCSPVTYAHRSSTPTLFFQHESDHRAPPGQTEQFYTVLKSRGVTAEMLRFPGTSHVGSVLGPVTHRRAQNEALLEWMDRYVLGEK
ncbi:MAG: S9 family peptidase [Saccharopolyspora sp.]|uniref:S9 family peptidase n=1 Tax=unclassified Saccharopolyspora TaxID=2646250 RepID=UPI0025F749A0|nr:S9 family peptidase [Saccharopolyspora sp.]MBQ6640305.1 S9 family peptidase [Saccharopolyspora sp.]